MTLVSRTITRQISAARRPALAGEGRGRPSQRGKAPADRLGQVGLTAALWGQRVAENLAQLGFHRAAVARGTDAQPLLYRRIDVANGQRGHRRPWMAEYRNACNGGPNGVGSGPERCLENGELAR
jgi:hypothetical protein